MNELLILIVAVGSLIVLVRTLRKKNFANRVTSISLFDAIAEDDFSAFTEKVEQGSDLTITDKDGNNLLHHAVRLGRLQFTDMLLQMNFPIDTRNHAGETALMIAVQTGNRNIVLKLLEAGSNPQLYNNKAQSALDLARSGYHYDIEGLLRTYAAELHVQNFR